MPHSVRYDGQARQDLEALTDWIEGEVGSEIAHTYVDRIRERCEELTDFPRRGRLRRRSAAIRSIPFRRNAIILYRVLRSEVIILRVLHHGRDVERSLAGLR